MIVTLAGHVDHGKTSLVRALTGVNTDRLAQEQARGLTIDLGFAYRDFDTDRIGFVDVPGHHRFIHNMVAGVASNQFALLVVAADDGPMPQTLEHLNILSLTGVRDGVIALTKTDRATDDRLREVEDAIRAATTGSFLADADIVRTSTESGAGIDQLAGRLHRAAADHQVRAPSAHRFRMAIDRTFTIRGSGLVVTGTVHSGTLAQGDACTVYPQNQSGRVRSLRAQDTDVQSVHVGDRAAVNITGIDPQTVRRGNWLAVPGSATTASVTLRLSVLADFPRPLKHWSPVHVYHATSHTTGRVALLEGSTIAPGGDALVDIVCDDPLLACHGDTLILRDQSLDRTLGGGRVVHTTPPGPRRRDPSRLARLACFQTDDPEHSYRQLVELEPVNLTEFARVWGLDRGELDAWISDDHVVDDNAIARDRWVAWRKDAIKALEAAHAANPDLAGLKSNELNVPFADAVIAELQRAGTAHVEDGFVMLPDHRQQLAPDLQNLLDRVTAALDAPQPPSSGDLSKSLKLPLPQLISGLTQIANQGYLIKVSDQRFFLPARWEDLMAAVEKLAADGPFNVRQYRDAAAIGRNVAIDILEHLDRRGITQRQGDTRVLRSTRKPN